MKQYVLLFAAVVLVAAIVLYRYAFPLWHPVYSELTGRRSVRQVLDQYGPAAEERLRRHFIRAGAAYPPPHVTLIGLKKEKLLELWAQRHDGWVFIRSYPVLAASGGPGPKLREGDRQVPEGIYQIIALNPNSSYHLSMKINYPNDFDREMGRNDGRGNLGTDIFIHGKSASIGCFAMGDEAIEELFTLVARVDMARTKVIIAPNDLRKGPPLEPVSASARPWVANLYADIQRELQEFSGAPSTRAHLRPARE
ncbi:MAG: L,D-transpeptidase family protein [Planctomycetia bacterium]|nr:L,D-transpeptidase family protein [Planctomycetia bacterium]